MACRHRFWATIAPKSNYYIPPPANFRALRPVHFVKTGFHFLSLKYVLTTNYEIHQPIALAIINIIILIMKGFICFPVVRIVNNANLCFTSIQVACLLEVRAHRGVFILYTFGK